MAARALPLALVHVRAHEKYFPTNRAAESGVVTPPSLRRTPYGLYRVVLRPPWSPPPDLARSTKSCRDHRPASIPEAIAGVMSPTGWRLIRHNIHMACAGLFGDPR